MENASRTTEPDDFPLLRAAWDELVRPYGPSAAAARRVRDDLLRSYADAGRFYHNPRHLREVLAHVDALAPLATDTAAVRLAAWFHDAIYDTRAPDNEERSAVLCERELTQLGLPPATVAAAAEMIRATRDHRPCGATADSAILLDADLAILGAPPDEYARYAAAIRREYAWVPEPEYRAGRQRVLQAFLERERIYLTAPMANREKPARQNLRAEIDQLQ